MKVVLLAGGMGTRLGEETHRVPKPMVEVGGRPLLWHIMKHYSAHGLNDFVICLGFKGYVIKEYFSNYFLHCSDVTFDMRDGSRELHSQSAEPWRVTLIDTGQDTMTGGRLRRVRKYLGNESFCVTYGDGVSDVDVTALVKFHRSHGKLATVTAVSPPGRFGVLDVEDGEVRQMREKPQDADSLINGGYFVLEPAALDTIAGDDTSWEREPLARLAGEDQLRAFVHRGFWHAVDTLREKQMLEEVWAAGNAPWMKTP